MKLFIVFFIFIPWVYSDLHTLITTYTGINGQTIAGTPEFSVVTTLDDHQIDYYDSNINELIPRQAWMKEFASTHMWKEYTRIREKEQQINRNNNHDIMETFSHTGVHVYQRRYGCVWDDETGYSRGFDQHGFDGEDFISLDLKGRYTPSVPQATPTVEKWNNDREQLKSLKQYYDYECVHWLRRFLNLSKDTFNKAELPKVSLLQKKQDNYVGCHVTGFLFRNTHISWRKNGQANHPSNLIHGDTLPNEDGTFQKTLTLYILPDEWKKDQYTCVVEHKSWADPIQKTLTEDQIKTNKPASDSSNLKYDKSMAGNKTNNRSGSDSSNIKYLALIIIPVILVLIGLYKLKDYCKKRTIYYKSKLSQEQAPSQDSLLSNPSIESSSPPDDGICDSSASPDSFRDEHDHSPEPSPSSPVDGSSQPFLTTESCCKVQETSEDL